MPGLALSSTIRFKTRYNLRHLGSTSTHRTSFYIFIIHTTRRPSHHTSLIVMAQILPWHRYSPAAEPGAHTILRVPHNPPTAVPAHIEQKNTKKEARGRPIQPFPPETHFPGHMAAPACTETLQQQGAYTDRGPSAHKGARARARLTHTHSYQEFSCTRCLVPWHGTLATCSCTTYRRAAAPASEQSAPCPGARQQRRGQRVWQPREAAAPRPQQPRRPPAVRRAAPPRMRRDGRRDERRAPKSPGRRGRRAPTPAAVSHWPRPPTRPGRNRCPEALARPPPKNQVQV
jgi:hypothetical protein